MNTKLALFSAVVSFLAFAATTRGAEELMIESTFVSKQADGRDQVYKLPVVRWENGAKTEMHIANFLITFGPLWVEEGHLMIPVTVAETKPDGKTRVITRPTIFTMVGKAATVSAGDVELKLLVTLDD